MTQILLVYDATQAHGEQHGVWAILSIINNFKQYSRNATYYL